MYWKVIYTPWYSISKHTMYVKAETKEEAYSLADAKLGYEGGDIMSAEPITEEEILKNTVIGY